MLDEYFDSCGQLLKLVRRPVLQAARVSGGSLAGAAQGLRGLPNPQPGDLQRGQSLLETCGPCDPPGVTLVASLSSAVEGLGQPAWPLTAGHCWGPYRLARRTAGGHLAAGRCVAATLWARRCRPASEGPAALGTALAAGVSHSLWLPAESQPLPGSEKDLHRLSAAAAWPQLGAPRQLSMDHPANI